MTSPFALDHDFGASHGPLASKYYRTDDDIRIALNACLLEDLEGLNCPIAEDTYGWLPYWDLVQVSDLSFLFRNVGNATLFRADVSQWRIAASASTFNMFNGARAFSQHFVCESAHGPPSSCVGRRGDMDMRIAVDSCLHEDPSGLSCPQSERIYGKMRRWDTSLVTNMAGLFKDKANFEGDISMWDTSRVSSMEQIFSGAIVFNGDVRQWHTGSVTNFDFAFKNAFAFNGTLSGWNTESAESMRSMFSGAANFLGRDYPIGMCRRCTLCHQCLRELLHLMRTCRLGMLVTSLRWITCLRMLLHSEAVVSPRGTLVA